MKFNRSFLIQILVWLTIWCVFALTTEESHKHPLYYTSLTIRIIGFAALYNAVSYGLMPFYTRGKKQHFVLWSLVVFMLYITLSFFIDQYFRQFHPKYRDKKVPIVWMIMPPVVLGLTIFGSAASVRGLSEIEKNKLAIEEANNKRLEAEIMLVKSQINPHFMLNTLNNLYAISLTDPDKTPDAILKLSQMVNYILYECTKEKVLLDQDLNFIENFIALQQLRLADNVVLDINIPKMIAKSLTIEPMILIPFIENAFKHGITTKGNCTILCHIRLQECLLIMDVRNSIIQRANLSSHEGIGLANTIQRLDRSYTNKYLLKIDDHHEQYSVHLEMNLDA